LLEFLYGFAGHEAGHRGPRNLARVQRFCAVARKDLHLLIDSRALERTQATSRTTFRHRA
jgi:hypothetical protein